ncbi:exonuclease SbcCD subunit D [Candidatus Woesearchaeota archaeon]|nr:MAG: exonuclease SbcCD subunit D [Candidatus Woesearchaeota archaeon]
MRFAHISDCHIGGWRDPRLRDANARSFKLAISKCIERRVDFVLISGDLFNTAVPAIDSLRMAVEQLRCLKDANIPVYIIAGSHDFSPSGKTMLDVLERAALVVCVAKGRELDDGRLRLEFTQDPKTGVKITGMVGKKGGLEAGYYSILSKENLEREPGKKIFLFHTALQELKPKGLEKMEAMPVSYLPRGFDYYAGGHVHIVKNQSIGPYSNIVYPGPVFPNNFRELEQLKCGSFVIVEDGNIEFVKLPVNEVVSIEVSAKDKTPLEVESEIRSHIGQHSLKDAIVTIRVKGCLIKGRPADINWNDLVHDCSSKGAYATLRNTSGLASREIELISLPGADVDHIEERLVQEHAPKFSFSRDDVGLSKSLIQVLSAEKKEGERIGDFESRLHSELDSLFDLSF